MCRGVGTGASEGPGWRHRPRCSFLTALLLLFGIPSTPQLRVFPAVCSGNTPGPRLQFLWVALHLFFVLWKLSEIDFSVHSHSDVHLPSAPLSAWHDVSIAWILMGEWMDEKSMDGCCSRWYIDFTILTLFPGLWLGHLQGTWNSVPGPICGPGCHTSDPCQCKYYWHRLKFESIVVECTLCWLMEHNAL